MNEPYGSEQVSAKLILINFMKLIIKADYTPQNAFGKWPDFWKWVEDLAAVKGITTDDVKIIGPSENGSHIFQKSFYKTYFENYLKS